MEENLSELEKQFQKDAKKILNHAIKHGVPAEWYWHHLEGHVFRATEQIHSDIDFLLKRGEEAERWYEDKAKEYERRKKIFGKKKE